MTVIQIPSMLAFREALLFPVHLSQTTVTKECTLDFIGLQHVPPFGMLFVSAAWRQFIDETRTKGLDSPRFLNADLNDFAAHMGFYQSCGADHGNAPGQTSGNERYIPITRIDITDFRRQSSSSHSHINDAIEDKCDQMARVLSQENPQLISTLTYTLRELIRNVVEHSESGSVWLCAQSRPSQDEIELAILDEGRGIRAAISARYPVSSEIEAIRLAKKEGVSSRSPLQSDSLRTNVDDWEDTAYDENQNAGYGLFIISELCEKAGSLAIVSNNGGVVVSRDSSGHRSEKLVGTVFRGTAIRVILRPARAAEVLRGLLGASGSLVRRSRITPSMILRLRDR